LVNQLLVEEGDRVKPKQTIAILNQLSKVRPVDLQEAQAELNYAIAQVQRLETELEDYYVRVPLVIVMALSKTLS
jgi:HlyD family secretion protein